jgi:ribonuclease E
MTDEPALYPSGNGRQPEEAAAPPPDLEERPDEGRSEAPPVVHEPLPLQAEEYRPAPIETPPAEPTAEEVAKPAEEPAPQLQHVEEEDTNRPKRGGWWQRRSFF